MRYAKTVMSIWMATSVVDGLCETFAYKKSRAIRFCKNGIPITRYSQIYSDIVLTGPVTDPHQKIPPIT